MNPPRFRVVVYAVRNVVVDFKHVALHKRHVHVTAAVHDHHERKVAVAGAGRVRNNKGNVNPVAVLYPPAPVRVLQDL